MSMDNTRAVGLVLVVLLSVPIATLSMTGVTPSMDDSDGVVTAQSTDNKYIYSADGEGVVRKMDAQTGDVIWTYDNMGSNEAAAVTVDVDRGRVYAAQDQTGVHAIDSQDGSNIWTTTGITAYNGMAVGDDGTIYQGDYSGNVHVLNPDGSIEGSHTIHSQNINDLEIQDGTLYSASDDEDVHATDTSDMTNVWSYTQFTDRVVGLDVDSDGIVYAGGYDAELHAIDGGSQTWTYGFADSVFGVATSNGTVFAGLQNQNTVHAIDTATQSQDWVYSGHTANVDELETGEDMDVFSGSSDETMRSLNTTDGTENWNATDPSYINGLAYQSGSPQFATGQVVNPDGGAIEGANVSFTNQDTGATSNVTTDATGSFSIFLDDGAYDIEITHIQYRTYRESRMIQTGDDLGELVLDPAGVRIVTGERIDPNESMSFRVEYWSDDDWTNVTDDSANLTVTSDNTSILTVDQDRAKLFSEANVNGTVNVTAEYVRDGETYNYTAEIVVATLSIGNLDILPEAYWPTTILRDSTLQWVGMGLLMGLAFARITGNPWAGLGTAEFVLSFGWMIGFVTAGVMLASLFYVAAASIMIADVYRPRR